MPIRSAFVALASAAALLAPGPADAQSPIMSVNHVVTDQLPHDTCMRRAADTLLVAGLRHFDTTSEAVWGMTQDNRYMVSIYCLTTRDVAVVAATGANGNVTSSLVDSLLSAWNRAR